MPDAPDSSPPDPDDPPNVAKAPDPGARDAPEPNAGEAPGAPGIGPTWSPSQKEAVGTSQFASRVWFTIGMGILNEVYWPRVDRPQTRDLGFIVADDAGFWSEVKRDAAHEVHYAQPGIPAITVTHTHRRYKLVLRICCNDHADVVHIEARLTDRRDAGDPDRTAHPLRLYPLLAPHLGFSGLHNRAWVGGYKGREMVFAQKGPSAVALASDPPPTRQSVGYVGVSDGWQDFAANGRMTWTYGTTGEGNVAGMTEIVLEEVVGDDQRASRAGRKEASTKPGRTAVTPGRGMSAGAGGVADSVGVAWLALAFGTRPEEAALQASASLAGHFQKAWDEYVASWRDFVADLTDFPTQLPAEDKALYLTSAAVLATHGDRTVPGAIVASLSIPWGNTRNDLGGYHLVWSRDLVEAGSALVALGAQVTARRTLAYLVATQEPPGYWVQNQWVDGVAYWSGIQLDEAAYPILLAGALRRGGAVELHGLTGDEAADFEHLLTEEALELMIASAARFIAQTGPATQQDRWEENAGLTPSTLAPIVAALVVAADHNPDPAATYLRELADDWNASIEEWTYATGTRLARDHGVDGYYVRIVAPEVLAGAPLSTPVPIRNRPSEASSIPTDEMIGTDFLALVRFGLRLPSDPHILSTLKIADALLKTETPNGPVWHRYTGDGYGEHEDGSAYDGTGIGRGWPLLVGERGHYELEAGHDARPYLETMRRMASRGGMLPEQVWDAAPIRGRHLEPGKPTGSAMPLAWAHAEFVKLVRSIAVGHAIDRPEAAWARYRGLRPAATRALWRFTAQRPTMPTGRTLRLEVLAPARVRYTLDGWKAWADVDARDTGVGVWVADVPGSKELAPGGAIDFTFWWPDATGGADAGHWEGRNFQVSVVG